MIQKAFLGIVHVCVDVSGTVSTMTSSLPSCLAFCCPPTLFLYLEPLLHEELFYLADMRSLLSY